VLSLFHPRTSRETLDLTWDHVRVTLMSLAFWGFHLGCSIDRRDLEREFIIGGSELHGNLGYDKQADDFGLAKLRVKNTAPTSVDADNGSALGRRCPF
jgi:hypothetical protein